MQGKKIFLKSANTDKTTKLALIRSFEQTVTLSLRTNLRAKREEKFLLEGQKDFNDMLPLVSGKKKKNSTIREYL